MRRGTGVGWGGGYGLQGSSVKDSAALRVQSFRVQVYGLVLEGSFFRLPGKS